MTKAKNLSGNTKSEDLMSLEVAGSKEHAQNLQETKGEKELHEETNMLPADVFELHESHQLQRLFANFRNQLENTEVSICAREDELIKKENKAFRERAAIIADTNVKEAHERSMAELQKRQAMEIEARQLRKAAKRAARNNIRNDKIRDFISQTGSEVAALEERLRITIGEMRAEQDTYLDQLQLSHRTMRKSQNNCQDRQLSMNKTLMLLENQHMSESERFTVEKRLQTQQSHARARNKRANDILREAQLQEIRHLKEMEELRFQSFQFLSRAAIDHKKEISGIKLRHLKEEHAVKENILIQWEIEKEQQLIEAQKTQLETCQRVFENQQFQKPTKNKTRARSATYQRTVQPSFRIPGERKLTKLESIANGLNPIIEKHRKELEDVEAAYQSMVSLKKEQDEQEETKLAIKHSEEVNSLTKEHEIYRNELVITQKKETEMDETVIEAERKLLAERRVLGSILDTAIDGVINIDIEGTIIRFNQAAQNIFGYAESEVIGNGIEMLMPLRFAQNHKEYIKRYLTTGEARVIGSGRQIIGLHKNGIEFPFYLSLAEIIEEGNHIFTGIIRDLTAKVQSEVRYQQEKIAEDKEIHDKGKALADAIQESSRLYFNNLPLSLLRQIKNLQNSVDRADWKQDSKFKSELVKAGSGKYKNCTVAIVELQITDKYTDKIEKVQDIIQSFNSIVEKAVSKYEARIVDRGTYMMSIISGCPVEYKDHFGEVSTLAIELNNRFMKKFNGEGVFTRIGIASGSVDSAIKTGVRPTFTIRGKAYDDAFDIKREATKFAIAISDGTHAGLNKDQFALEKLDRGYLLNSKSNFVVETSVIE